MHIAAQECETTLDPRSWVGWILENFTHWSVTFQNRSDDGTRHYPDRNSADVMGTAAKHSSVMMMALGSSYIEAMRCLACVSEYDQKRNREGGPLLANRYDRRRQLSHPPTDALR
jgi:hypothetical protein